MAAYEVLLLNTAIPQIQAAQSGDTYVVPRDIAINATAIISANSATDALRITQTGAGNAILVEDSANPDSTPFVVTATGDVGIGTSSPAQPLDVVSNSSANAISIRGRTADDIGTLNFSTNAGSIIAQIQSRPNGNELRFLVAGARSQTFYTNGSEQMRLDSSGNLGLGVTPSAWNGIYKVIQTDVGSIYSSSSYNNVGVGANVFYNAANSPRYIRSDYATLYGQDDGLHAWYTAASGTAGNLISFTQAMTLSATSGPALRVGVTADLAGFNFQGANQVGFSVHNSGSSATAAYFSAANNVTLTSAGNFAVINGVDGILFGASATERARITSGGYFKASNDGTYLNSAGTYHEINQTANDNILFIRSTDTAYSVDGVQLRFSRNTTNNSFYVLSYYNATAAAYKFRVADSGDVTNTNGTYGTISDAKMKTDIVDAGSQWSDIKALRFRKFKMKDDPSGLVQLGVVAQEVEQTSPGLVDEHADKDAEGNDLGTTTKSVKTSVLLMKAAVALQEAMARIEKLEAEVAALKGA